MKKTLSTVDTFILTLFYLSKSVIIGILTLYLIQLPIPLSQIALLGSISSIVIIVFEFPTGVLGDYISLKLVLLLSIIFSIIGNVFYIIHPTYIFISLATICIALSTTLSSGSMDAYLIQKNQIQNEQISILYADLNVIRILSNLMGGIIGILIYYQNVVVPYYISIGLLLVTFVLLFLQKDINSTKNNKVETFIQLMKEPLILVKGNKWLIQMIYISISFMFSITTLYSFWQPILLEYHFTINEAVLLSSTFLINSLSLLLGSILFKRFVSKWQQHTRVFYYSLVSIGLIHILLFFIHQIVIVVILILAYYFLLAIVGPLRFRIINEHVTNSNRASILSFYSLMDSIGTILYGGISFILLQVLVLNDLLLISGIVLLSVLLILARPLLFKVQI